MLQTFRGVSKTQGPGPGSANPNPNPTLSLSQALHKSPWAPALHQTPAPRFNDPNIRHATSALLYKEDLELVLLDKKARFSRSHPPLPREASPERLGKLP